MAGRSSTVVRVPYVSAAEDDHGHLHQVDKGGHSLAFLPWALDGLVSTPKLRLYQSADKIKLVGLFNQWIIASWLPQANTLGTPGLEHHCYFSMKHKMIPVTPVKGFTSLTHSTPFFCHASLRCLAFVRWRSYAINGEEEVERSLMSIVTRSIRDPTQGF